MYYNSKHSGGPRRRNRKGFVLIAALALLLALAIGGTIAFLTDATADVENTFTPGQVVGTIVEKVDNNVKKSITVKNEGNIPCYVRVAMVTNWVNSEGQICTLHDANLTVDYNTTDWELGTDGFYYHKAAVDPGDSTENLLKGNISLEEAADGCKLQVEVLSSVIQSTLDTTAQGAWAAAKTN